VVVANTQLCGDDGAPDVQALEGGLLLKELQVRFGFSSNRLSNVLALGGGLVSKELQLCLHGGAGSITASDHAHSSWFPAKHKTALHAFPGCSHLVT